MYEFIGKKGQYYNLKLNSNCKESEKTGGEHPCSGSEHIDTKISINSPDLSKIIDNVSLFSKMSKNQIDNLSGSERSEYMSYALNRYPYKNIMSKNDMSDLEDKINDEKSDIAQLFNKFDTYASKWKTSSDAYSRELAVSIVQNNPDIGKFLLHKQFGLVIPKKVTLYRLGQLGPETNSFFLSQELAREYSKQYGTGTFEKYEVSGDDVNYIIPMITGLEQIWVPNDVNLEYKNSIK